MKKNLSALLAILLIFCSTESFTQETPRKKKSTFITVGIGSTFNRVGGTRLDGWERSASGFSGVEVGQWKNIGFAFNLDLQRQISRLWYLKSGLGYIKKRVIVGIDDPEIPGSDKIKRSYLTIPALIGMNIKPEQSRFNAWMELGASIGFAFRNETDNISWIATAKENVMSLNAGTGIKYSISPSMNCLISYNFIYDVSNAYEYPALYINDVKTYYRFRSHALNLGIQMRLR